MFAVLGKINSHSASNEQRFASAMTNGEYERILLMKWRFRKNFILDLFQFQFVSKANSQNKEQ